MLFYPVKATLGLPVIVDLPNFNLMIVSSLKPLSSTWASGVRSTPLAC